ncbi:MAG: metallophosphoesterase family protein [Endozoicomonas sp.]|uniref:metallophosphoesterase family protein n=1 Tax=Endozoicomonas sp. TaxID=1892382 RepID=UPI003D9B1E80
MKFLLASNTLEHFAFKDFIRAALHTHTNAHILFTGDLLNVFPEPGENLEGSIFFELFGDIMVREMKSLIHSRFRDVQNSKLTPLLKQMFQPMGDFSNEAKQIARQRYSSLFTELEESLGEQNLWFIPGNMDYPDLAEGHTFNSTRLIQLDQSWFEADGLKVSGLGGIPNTAHPFRNVTEISPYEMCETEYLHRLNKMVGTDVLLTHLSPDEFPPLKDFLMETQARLLICRAPFDFRRQSDFRGALKVRDYADGKSVIMVRPFDYPSNQAYVLDLFQEMGPVKQHLDVFYWSHRSPLTE